MGPWLAIHQPGGISYYGECHGTTISLDVYEHGLFTGYQAATLNGPESIQAAWITFGPSARSGHESWHRL